MAVNIALPLIDTPPEELAQTSLHVSKRVVRNGVSTNDLVRSAYADGNESVFPKILDLYVKPGSVVADVTYGKGVFWRHIPVGRYDVRATDIQSGVDCRNLPYDDGEVDCVVLDPPYMHSPGGTAHQAHEPFEKYYANNGSGNQTKSKYHEAVLNLYRDAGEEANRVLRQRGVFIVKCQDEVCSNQQRFYARRNHACLPGDGFRRRRPFRGGEEQPARCQSGGEASPLAEKPFVFSGFLEAGK